MIPNPTHTVATYERGVQLGNRIRELEQELIATIKEARAEGLAVFVGTTLHAEKNVHYPYVNLSLGF